MFTSGFITCRRKLISPKRHVREKEKKSLMNRRNECSFIFSFSCTKDKGNSSVSVVWTDRSCGCSLRENVFSSDNVYFRIYARIIYSSHSYLLFKTWNDKKNVIRFLPPSEIITRHKILHSYIIREGRRGGGEGGEVYAFVIFNCQQSADCISLIWRSWPRFRNSGRVKQNYVSFSTHLSQPQMSFPFSTFIGMEWREQRWSLNSKTRQKLLKEWSGRKRQKGGNKEEETCETGRSTI